MERLEYICENGNDYCLAQFTSFFEAKEYAIENKDVKVVFEYNITLDKDGCIENAELVGAVWERYKEDYAPKETKISGKYGLYNYIWEHFTLDAGACGRIVENLIDYVDARETDRGELTPDGLNIIETVIADALGMDKSEIIENWG